ncbi:MAG: hypothetical protein A3I10_02385 [Deltaproteobacteria bacterium RIFCSPLOWO2_02_FULL_57_26]|nr:MAG: hypothetical protein A3I10_02385 [Deltaproteobacteria bacterium RIFCSPLOWO2_02_FULL_57_26]
MVRSERAIIRLKATITDHPFFPRHLFSIENGLTADHRRAGPERMEAEIKKLGLPVTFLNPELGRFYTFTK